MSAVGSWAPSSRASPEATTGPTRAGVCRVAETEPRIAFIYLFGSLARRHPGPRSDVDLAVQLVEPLPLVEEARLHDRQFRILGEGLLLFSRDERGRVAFRARVEQEFQDFQHVATPTARRRGSWSRARWLPARHGRWCR